MKYRKSQRFVSLLILGFLLAVILISANRDGMAGQSSAQAAADEQSLAGSGEAAAVTGQPLANCRYGVVAGYGEEVHVPRIGAGWFLDFNPPLPPLPVAGNGAEFVHMLLVYQRKTQDGHYLPGYRTEIPLDQDFADFISANPGDLWLIGNEVDRGPNPDEAWSGQGDMYPHIYAQAYHDVRTFIKKHDPTARTAISGLVQVTPGRLQYLDKVWAAYQQLSGGPMPVDIWNMHVYVLPEVEADGITPNGIASVAVGTDPALGKRSSGGSAQACSNPDVYCFAEHDSIEIFGEQVVAMRQWMKDHGQQQKPLILSEFSLLYPYMDEGATCFLQDEYGNCFTPDRVASFMSNAFDYLNGLEDEELGYALDGHRLVQQWTWFSIYTDAVGTVSNILENDQQTLSVIGEKYRQIVFAEPPVVNLLIEDIPAVNLSVDPAAGTATAPLSVTFRNNGNTAVNEPFTVSFFADQARQQMIGTVIINEPARGCATNVYRTVLNWPNLAPGQHRFWVTVDGGDRIVEGPPGQADNRGTGLVTVYPESTYFPIIIH